MEASGNLAGITMPLLSKDDNIASRLSRAAFLFALGYWDKLGGIGTAIEGAGCGVLLVARDAAHAGLQRATAAARRFPPAYAEWLDSDAAAARFGAPRAGRRLAVPAGRLDPAGQRLPGHAGRLRPALAAVLRRRQRQPRTRSAPNGACATPTDAWLRRRRP